MIDQNEKEKFCHKLADGWFYSNVKIKIFIMYFYPILLTIMSTFVGSWSKENASNFTIYLIIVAILTAFYIFSVYIYSIPDNQNKKRILELEEELNTKNNNLAAFESLSYSLRGIETNSAALTNKMVAFNSATGKICLNATNYETIAELVCSAVYNLLGKYSQEEGKFEVSYFKSQVKKGKKTTHFLKMIAQCNSTTIQPSIYQQEISMKGGKQYYFKQLFKKQSANIDALADPQQINEKFVSHDDKPISWHKYCQYIGIPVVCEQTGEMVGLLQVISFKENALGDSNESLKKFAERYLLIYAKYLLFACNIDKSILKLIEDLES